LEYASIPMVVQVLFITEEYYILGCTAVQSGKSLWTFREKVVSPSSVSKREPKASRTPIHELIFFMSYSIMNYLLSTFLKSQFLLLFPMVSPLGHSSVRIPRCRYQFTLHVNLNYSLIQRLHNSKGLLEISGFHSNDCGGNSKVLRREVW
jgi:hypothetical protein